MTWGVGRQTKKLFVWWGVNKTLGISKKQIKFSNTSLDHLDPIPFLSEFHLCRFLWWVISSQHFCWSYGGRNIFGGLVGKNF